MLSERLDESKIVDADPPKDHITDDVKLIKEADHAISYIDANGEDTSDQPTGLITDKAEEK